MGRASGSIFNFIGVALLYDISLLGIKIGNSFEVWGLSVILVLYAMLE